MKNKNNLMSRVSEQFSSTEFRNMNLVRHGNTVTRIIETSWPEKLEYYPLGEIIDW